MKEFNHNENELKYDQKILKSSKNLQLNFLPTKDKEPSGQIMFSQNKCHPSFQSLLNKNRDFHSQPPTFQDSYDKNIDDISNTCSAASKFKNRRRLPKYYVYEQTNFASSNISNQFDSQNIKNAASSKRFGSINLQDRQNLIFEKNSNKENHLFQKKLMIFLKKLKMIIRQTIFQII